MADRYEIKEYQPEDLFFIVRDPKALAVSLGRPEGELAEQYKKNGPAYTAYVEGVRIGMAGVNILWPGTGEAWALFGNGYEQYGIFIHRSAKRFLDVIAAEHKMIRIQAVAENTSRVAISWLFHLGFEYEGERPFYWRGKTFLGFAKIYKENL